MFKSVSSCTLILAASTVLLFANACAPAQKQDTILTDESAKVKSDADREAAVDQWHNYVVDRLNVLDPAVMGRPTMGHGSLATVGPAFGFNRILRTEDKYRTKFNPIIRAQLDVIQLSFASLKLEAGLSLYGSKTQPIDFKTATFKTVEVIASKSAPTPRFNSLGPDQIPLVKAALADGEKAESTEGEVHRFARVVHITSEKCQSCHTGMKLNDPVAVAIYSVRSEKASSSH